MVPSWLVLYPAITRTFPSPVGINLKYNILIIANLDDEQNEREASPLIPTNVKTDISTVPLPVPTRGLSPTPKNGDSDSPGSVGAPQRCFFRTPLRPPKLAQAPKDVTNGLQVSFAVAASRLARRK